MISALLLGIFAGRCTEFRNEIDQALRGHITEPLVVNNCTTADGTIFSLQPRNKNEISRVVIALQKVQKLANMEH